MSHTAQDGVLLWLNSIKTGAFGECGSLGGGGGGEGEGRGTFHLYSIPLFVNLGC